MIKLDRMPLHRTYFSACFTTRVGKGLDEYYYEVAEDRQGITAYVEFVSIEDRSLEHIRKTGWQVDTKGRLDNREECFHSSIEDAKEACERHYNLMVLA